MDILNAKKSLYMKLKIFAEVIGAGIKEKNGTEYIVIFISNATKKLLEAIPKEFEGNLVETELKMDIRIQK